MIRLRSKSILLLSLVWVGLTQAKDLDLSQDVMNIIWRHGFNCEKHTVETPDGFFLTLFRIPRVNGSTNSNKKQPVLVQHGLFSDSSTWVISKNESLAFILAKEGYDVWLGNFRGTHYSLRNKYFTSRQYGFWDWCWDEMAYYDLPAFFKYINSVTNQQLLYIGHSMGTTTFFASSSMFPDNSKYVKAMFALAPVVYENGIKGISWVMAPIAKSYDYISKVLGFGEFLPNDGLVDRIVKYACGPILPAFKKACLDGVFLASGFDPEGFNSTYLPAMAAHLPSSTSVRTVIHFSQMVTSKEFQKYDFGKKTNLVKYQEETPPVYNISKITIPIACYWGDNDWLAQKSDADRMWKQIQNKIRFYKIPAKGFEHMDMIFAKNVTSLVFAPLLEDMKKFG